MSDPVTLAEAKLFLRVSHEEEDTLISTLITASATRIETVLGLTLDAASPAPLRLAVLDLVARAYDTRGEDEISPEVIEGWIAPYREVRL